MKDLSKLIEGQKKTPIDIETEIIYYDNSNKKKETNYFKDRTIYAYKEGFQKIKHGIETIWYGNGKIYSENEYDRGSLLSSITWEKNGKKREGAYRFPFVNKKEDVICNYRNGILDGKYLIVKNNNYIFEAGVDPDTEGLDAEKYDKEFDSIVLDEEILFEANYKDGLLQGRCTEWDLDKNEMRVINYQEGKKHGLEEHFFENGKLGLQINWNYGEQHGLVIDWHKNGNKKSQTTFVNNEKYGLATEWYEDGSKKSELVMKNHYEDGLHTEWYENGNIKQQCIFEDGCLIGDAKIWSENGRLEVIQNRKYGEGCMDILSIVETEYIYDKNGKIISKIISHSDGSDKLISKEEVSIEEE